ncbi:MAG: alpha/beta hydrolase [Candidatus Eremiobacteraeota bacterium]|nr:alpha/beta hydrolase [Candidatus Eremiobacteraeota bacterium]
MRFTSRDGTTLAGTLTVPNDARGPVAAVVLVHGSGPLDRDETIGPNKIFLQIAHALSNRNFAVLRYDKRGIGASGGRYIGATRQELLADAEAAVAFAAHDPAIDPQRVFVLGHSEGAELAPSVAADVPAVRGIVLLGAPALPLDQVLIKQVTRGLSGAPLNDAREKAAREYEQIKTGGNADPSAPWLRSWFGVDPAALIARVPCPILVMQGGKDIQVLPADMPRLVDAARAAGRDVTVRFFPDDDHLFIDVPGDAPSTGAEYLVPAALDPAMLTAAADWLAAHNVRLVPSH